MTPKPHGAPITERQYTVLRILTARSTSLTGSAALKSVSSSMDAPQACTLSSSASDRSASV
jgi:hypothetical protein